ncbi:MAG TPA: DUF1801 domain-containing protein [Gemmatimonadaceae bacterium]|jgi:hypothetical protein
MKHDASTVEDYLAGLPPDRRAVVSKVRNAIRKSIPKGYAEAVRWSAITWEVPLSRFPKTYNNQPLSYVALAAQKNYYALHLMRAYGDKQELARIQDGFRKAGKKLDMGKACIRFKKLEDLPLHVITDSVARTTPDEWIRMYESSRSGGR